MKPSTAFNDAAISERAKGELIRGHHARIRHGLPELGEGHGGGLGEHCRQRDQDNNAEIKYRVSERNPEAG
jgi:hypothetical protein